MSASPPRRKRLRIQTTLPQLALPLQSLRLLQFLRLLIHPHLHPTFSGEHMNILDDILKGLQIATGIASAYPATAAPALLVDKLLAIAQAAVAAHEAATGKPLDLTLLHQIAPVA
jgi:hypothetical protein